MSSQFFWKEPPWGPPRLCPCLYPLNITLFSPWSRANKPSWEEPPRWYACRVAGRNEPSGTSLHDLPHCERPVGVWPSLPWRSRWLFIGTYSTCCSTHYLGFSLTCRLSDCRDVTACDPWTFLLCNVNHYSQWRFGINNRSLPTNSIQADFPSSILSVFMDKPDDTFLRRELRAPSKTFPVSRDMASLWM